MHSFNFPSPFASGVALNGSTASRFIATPQFSILYHTDVATLLNFPALSICSRIWSLITPELSTKRWDVAGMNISTPCLMLPGSDSTKSAGVQLARQKHRRPICPSHENQKTNRNRVIDGTQFRGHSMIQNGCPVKNSHIHQSTVPAYRRLEAPRHFRCSGRAKDPWNGQLPWQNLPRIDSFQPCLSTCPGFRPSDCATVPTNHPSSSKGTRATAGARLFQG